MFIAITVLAALQIAAASGPTCARGPDRQATVSVTSSHAEIPSGDVEQALSRLPGFQRDFVITQAHYPDLSVLIGNSPLGITSTYTVAVRHLPSQNERQRSNSFESLDRPGSIAFDVLLLLHEVCAVQAFTESRERAHPISRSPLHDWIDIAASAQSGTSGVHILQITATHFDTASLASQLRHESGGTLLAEATSSAPQYRINITGDGSAFRYDFSIRDLSSGSLMANGAVFAVNEDKAGRKLSQTILSYFGIERRRSSGTRSDWNVQMLESNRFKSIGKARLAISEDRFTLLDKDGALILDGVSAIDVTVRREVFSGGAESLGRMGAEDVGDAIDSTASCGDAVLFCGAAVVAGLIEYAAVGGLLQLVRTPHYYADFLVQDDRGPGVITIQLSGGAAHELRAFELEAPSTKIKPSESPAEWFPLPIY